MAVDNDYLDDLESEDVDVLRECLRVVDERAALERERGKNAEARAGTTLGFLGVVAGALALLVGASSDSAPSVLALTFIGLATGLLAKASYYGLRAVGVHYGKKLDHHLAKTVQKGDLLDGLKAEIAWKRWEIDQVILPNTTRLYYLQRCQRNIFVAVFSLVLAAAAMKLGGLGGDWRFMGWLERLAGGAAAVILLGIDPLSERRLPWMKRQHENE